MDGEGEGNEEGLGKQKYIPAEKQIAGVIPGVTESSSDVLITVAPPKHVIV